MRLSDFKIDAVKKEEGAWVEVPQLPGISFKVRGIGNRDWNRIAAAETLAVPFSERKGGVLQKEQQERIVNKCIIEAGLLDWKGIDGDDGKPVAYSKEMAEKLINDPSFERFRDAVLAACNLVVEINQDDLEQVEKN